MLKAISLFSGVGGFEIGLGRAGIETVLQVENDPWCLSVLERHWPECERVTDVRKVDATALQGRRRDMVSVGVGSDAERFRDAGWGRDNATGVDLVYGGFPCQDLSVAGKRAGLRGERSGLWHEFHRVLRELRPRWTVIENVPGLLSSNGGADFGVVLRGMDDLGYGIAWRVLDARWFGVPQRRRRVFIVGCLGDAPRAAQVLAVCESCGGHSQTRSEERQDVAYALNASVRGTGDGHGNAWNSNYVADDIAHTLDDGARRASVELPMIAASLSAGGSQGVRRLTPLEAERLQGWPDDWTRYTADGREIPDSHRYRMIGNGVVSTVSEWIGHRLVWVDTHMSGGRL
jgi:DNA (cytosine-5)-methyltransferase 1